MSFGIRNVPDRPKAPPERYPERTEQDMVQ